MKRKILITTVLIAVIGVLFLVAQKSNATYWHWGDPTPFTDWHAGPDVVIKGDKMGWKATGDDAWAVSPVLDTGRNWNYIGYFGFGGNISLTKKIRGSTESFLWDAEAPAWEVYAPGVNKNWRYIQLRFEKAGGVACITLSGDKLQESFNSAGYDDADWAETNNPDEDSTDELSNAPCFTGQYLKCTASNQVTKNTFDAVGVNEVYATAYFYVVSEDLADGEDNKVMQIADPEGSNNEFICRLKQTAGQLQLIFENGGAVGDPCNVSLNTQYRIRMRVNNSADTEEWYVHDKDGIEVGSGSGDGYIGNDLGALQLGPCFGDANMTCYFDLVDVDTTGWAS